LIKVESEKEIGGRQQENSGRVFLFLQGHPSSFTRKLANELEHLGHTSLRINFCVGDALYWFGRKAVSYRGKFDNWPEFLRAFVEREGVTDILYYGDRRPYHIVAARIARELKINTFAFEFGYLRPDWITLERGGMSTYSHFPNDPEHIKKIATNFEKPDLESKYPYTKSTELFHEVTYNLSSYLLPFAYPFYKSDRYYNLLLEYLSGIPGLFMEKKRGRQARGVIDAIMREKHPYFLFPLQLQNDSQILHNSKIKHQKVIIDLVLRSFAQHARPQDHLIFKQHPLDNGWERWSELVERLSQNYGLSGRTHFIVGGDLHLLLNRARGCVVINSTVGISALYLGSPVHVLGTAIYDIDGLCHTGEMDDFWLAPAKPDKELTDALGRTLAGTIQVKGNFFSPEGQAAAIPEMARRLSEGCVNGAGAFVDPPPRLELDQI